MFGDDEDDEGACEGFSSLTTNFVDAVFIDLLFIRNKEQKPLPFTTIGIFISETENDMMSNASNRLKSRLEAAKRFNIIVLNKQLLSQGSSSISSSMCDYLVAIDTNDITLLKVASKYLMHGGLLLINKDSIPSLVSSLENEFDPISSKLQSCLLRKKLTRANSTATPYWLPDEKRELQSLESISIPLSVAERESGVFYTLTKIRAIKCLEVYGLCIFKGLFAAETIQRWGRAAVDDMRHVMATLRLRGIDLLELKDPTTEVESSSSTYIENFHEMSMREARRCDLRNGKAMTGVQKQADSHEKKSLDIRNHPGLIDVLTEVANPEGGEFASGILSFKYHIIVYHFISYFVQIN